MSTVKGVGVFGSGSKTLGTSTYVMTTSLNGHRATNKGSFSAGRAVNGFLWQQQLGVAGSLADNAAFTAISGTLDAAPAPVTVGGSYNWSTPSMFDSSRYNYSAEMGVSFKVTGYTGFWCMNLRSAIYHCANSASTCYFSLYAPTGNITAGWNA